MVLTIAVILQQCAQQRFSRQSALGKSLHVKTGRSEAVGGRIAKRIHGDETSGPRLDLVQRSINGEMQLEARARKKG